MHSLDSEKLARALDRGVALAQEREQREGTLPVFIQVSTDADTARGGCPLEQIPELVAIVEELENLDLQGFMVVPPLDSDPAEVFTRVKGLVEDVAKQLGRPLKLSAGMSADMQAAIESGTDIVRVGTGIMGPRPVV